jgi:uncharacterized iron-regulated membrane protein
MRLSRWIFRVHSWLGLIAGLFILSFFLTGGIIVFREELNKAENPHLFIVERDGQYLPYDSLYRLAMRQSPHLYLYSYRYIPQKADETIEMRVYDTAVNRYPLLYLNPYNGKVLGVENSSTYDILLRLHYQLFLGKIGEFLAAIFALALLGSLLTGVIVYRKFFWKALFFRIPLKFSNWRVASSNLHRIIGSWALLFNFILAFSGFYMMLYVFDVKSHFQPAGSEVVGPPPEVKVNIDSLIAKAESIIEGFEFHYLDFPRKQTDAIRVTGKSKAWLFGDYNNAVSFDYTTGEVKEVFREEALTAKEKFEYALYTLHYGQYGGKAIKILYSFFAFAGAVLTVTGFFLFYKRRLLKKRSRVALKPSKHSTSVNQS